MPTNFYFNNYPRNITSEQLLIENLVIESIKINGMDVYYMPRMNEENDDILYGENVNKTYTQAYQIEMYLENITGMNGEGDFISKFGLEIRDELELLVSRRRFTQTTQLFRPREGDLIYVPLVQNFFEITFIEHENNQAMFHTLGRGRGGNVYLFALKMKQFYFSNEFIKTGIEEIDEQIRDHYPRLRVALDSPSGRFAIDEQVYIGDSLEEATSIGYVYNYVQNSHLDLYCYSGEFAHGIVIGVESNSRAIVFGSDDTQTMDDVFETIEDNNRIQVESDLILNWDEKNPFGET